MFDSLMWSELYIYICDNNVELTVAGTLGGGNVISFVHKCHTAWQDNYLFYL